MGVVYLALDTEGRPLAIKVIRREFAADPAFRARFTTEVANARRVASFCTARVLDHGESGGLPYLVTEFVEGQSLEDYVRARGAFPAESLRALAVGMAAALRAIHAARLVHRDLKPANVLLSPTGPRVIDFGIARALDATGRQTATGIVLGSPGWMAPEQLFEGRSDTAADVFAWGTLVAFAAGGRHPYGTGNVMVLATRAYQGEYDLSRVPEDLRDLVATTLDPSPARRPSAADLLLALVGRGDEQSAQSQVTRMWTVGPPPVAPPDPSPATQSQPLDQASPPAAQPPPVEEAPATRFQPGDQLLIPASAELLRPGPVATLDPRTAPTQAPVEVEPPPPQRTRRTLALAIVALLGVLAVAGGTVTWAVLGRFHDPLQPVPEAVSASQEMSAAVSAVLSYDYRDAASVKDANTPMTERLRSSLAGRKVKPGAVQSAEVTQTGLVSFGGGRLATLVSVKASSGKRAKMFHARLSAVQESGRWALDTIDTLAVNMKPFEPAPGANWPTADAAKVWAWARDCITKFTNTDGADIPAHKSAVAGCLTTTGVQTDLTAWEKAVGPAATVNGVVLDLGSDPLVKADDKSVRLLASVLITGTSHGKATKAKVLLFSAELKSVDGDWKVERLRRLPDA